MCPASGANLTNPLRRTVTQVRVASDRVHRQRGIQCWQRGRHGALSRVERALSVPTSLSGSLLSGTMFGSYTISARATKQISLAWMTDLWFYGGLTGWQAWVGATAPVWWMD